jgi:hypothetical protein
MKKVHTIFQKTMLIAVIMVFVLASLPIAGNAQEEPTIFAIIDYMKVKPGNVDKYVDIEKTIWKPIHQELINQGKIVGWHLYEVRYTGTDDDYNYVTVTLIDNPASLENPYVGIDYGKILPGKDIAKAYEETLKNRDLVKSNLIIRQAYAYPDGGPVPFKYLEVDYMKVKPGEEDNYLDVEKNIWLPVHKEFIKAGTRVGWSLWSQQFPGGSKMDHQFATVNYFSDFSKIGMANYVDAFSKAHQGKDVNELFEKTGKSRELVRSELWELLDSVMKQK